MTHLERARELWVEEWGWHEWAGEILDHLEQQSPEERHKSLTLADLFEVCDGLAEKVLLMQRDLMATMVRVQHLEAPVDPTLAAEAAFAQGMEKGQKIGASAPTATAQRGEADLQAQLDAERLTSEVLRQSIAIWEKDCAALAEDRNRKRAALLTLARSRAGSPHYQWIRDIVLPALTDEDHLHSESGLYEHLGTADPLPAQTEPGERAKDEPGWWPLNAARDNLDRRAFRHTHVSHVHVGGESWHQHGPAPTPPSPAPECAHEWVHNPKDHLLWFDQSVVSMKAGKAARMLQWCCRCGALKLDHETYVSDQHQPYSITAPSLPTEGEGP